MDQLRQLIARLSLRQRVTVGIAAGVVLGGILLLARWNKERDFKPVFSNLPAEEAGLVINRIKESGTEYRLGDGGSTILVPSARVAELRLHLASEGLPKAGRIGFELFDKTNFGTTDFTEQVNFKRALEGELERSVTSLAEVEQARVHITFPKDSIYAESRLPAKASVMVKLRPGAKLSSQNVAAICHLAASAVEGLAPEAVSVLDMSGNLLNRPKKPGAVDGSEPSDAVLEYRQKIERDIMAKLHSTLEPLLGAEKYRAGVTVECDFTIGEQSEEVFDPTKSVMLTSQRTEDSSTGSSASGIPGTASNLPRPAARPASGTTGANRRTENITYQTSRFVKHVKLPQGTVRRVSVSVLLDHSIKLQEGKSVLEAPSPEKLKVVRDLVAGVAGIRTDRGDQVIVESFPFESTLALQAPAQTPTGPVPAQPNPAPMWIPVWLQQLVRQTNFAVLAGAAAGGILLLGIGFVWMIVRSRRRKGQVRMAAEIAEAERRKQLEAHDLSKQLEAKIAEQSALKEQQAKEVLATLKLPPVKTKKTEVLVKQISTEAKKDPVALAQVVRTWLNTSDYER